MRVRPLLALLALAVLGAPAQALGAAPDRSFTLTAASPSASFSPPATSGQYLTLAPLIEYDPAECSKDPDTYCDFTLIRFDAAAGSTAAFEMLVDGFDAPNDFDLYMYKSDAAGTIGDPVEEGADSSTGNPTPDPERLVVDALEPGYYMAIVVYFFVEDSTFNASLKVTGAVPGSTPPPSGGGTTPPPGGGQTPPPSTVSRLPFKAAATIGSAKRAKKKRSLSFKVTADEPISNLRVKLVKPKGATVANASLASLPKGTRTLKMKLSRRAARALRKGTYQIVATGTVNGQSRSVSQAVKIRA